jgi:hypothetical protein
VVGLVVETPLANGQVGAGVLYLLNHLDELLTLVVLKLLELFDGADLELMLRLRLGRLERAGQNSDLGVANLRRHLRVREVLVDDDALDQDSVFQRTAHLAVYLDQLEVDILANWSWALETILLPKLVLATLIRLSVSSLVNSITSEILSNSATAMSQA